MKKMELNRNYTFGIILILTLMWTPLLIEPSVISLEEPTTADDPKLVIYTYDSLLADPGYDFVEGFANHSGINVNEIQLVKHSDANTVLSKATLEKDAPVADVLIGLDNILIHKALEQDLLEPYESPALANISADLIANLDPTYHLLPYDYGIIALWYDTGRVGETIDEILENATLETILEEDLANNLIVQNPTMSSPGLGFLLWTIAVYGDPAIDFDGLLDQDWRDWWSAAKDDLRITGSWGDAWVEWADEDQNRTIMVSYGSSPAYSAVLYDYHDEKAVVSTENDTQNAWLQIEGLGLVKNARNAELAKEFIDWFLSTDLQDHISTNNWMYPANIHASIDPVFESVAINPADVTILNDLFTSETIGENLNRWLAEWEEIIAGPIIIPGYPLLWLLLSTLAAAAVLHFRKRKQI